MERLLDTFTAGDGTPISSHAPETGGTWVVSTDITNGIMPTITGGKLHCPSNGGPAAQMVYNAGGALLTGENNWVATVKVTFVDDVNTAGFASLLLTTNSSDNPGNMDYLATIDWFASAGSGGITLRGAAQYDYDFVLGTEYTLKFSFVAPTLTAYLNDVQVATSTGPFNWDNSAAPNGRLGLEFQNLNGADQVFVNSVEFGAIAQPLSGRRVMAVSTALSATVGELLFYDADTLEKLSAPDVPALARAVSLGFSPDGETLFALTAPTSATGYYALTTDGGGVSGAFSPSPPTGSSTNRSMAVDPSGGKIAFGLDSLVLPVYDAHTLVGETGTPIPPSAIQCMDFSPDGSKLAVGVATSTGSRLLVYRTDTWAPITLGASITAPCTAVRWSPDGSKLAVGISTNSTLFVYNTVTWTYTTHTGTLGSSIRWLTFSHDGSKLAVSTPYSGGTVSVRDTSTWATITTLPNMPGGAPNTAFSPDDSYLALCAPGLNYSGDPSDYYFRRYNTSTWALLPVLAEPPIHSSYFVAFGDVPVFVEPPFWTNYVKTQETI